MDDSLREKLAAIEHERWADWQKWCHKILRENLRFNDMESNLEEILSRWERQIATPYEELSGQEKASDMEQVDRYWPLIKEYITQHSKQYVKRVLPEKKLLTLEDYDQEHLDSLSNSDIEVSINFRQGWNAYHEQTLKNMEGQG